MKDSQSIMFRWVSRKCSLNLSNWLRRKMSMEHCNYWQYEPSSISAIRWNFASEMFLLGPTIHGPTKQVNSTLEYQRGTGNESCHMTKRWLRTTSNCRKSIASFIRNLCISKIKTSNSDYKTAVCYFLQWIV